MDKKTFLLRTCKLKNRTDEHSYVAAQPILQYTMSYSLDKNLRFHSVLNTTTYLFFLRCIIFQIELNWFTSVISITIYDFSHLDIAAFCLNISIKFYLILRLNHSLCTCSTINIFLNSNQPIHVNLSAIPFFSIPFFSYMRLILGSYFLWIIAGEY